MTPTRTVPIAEVSVREAVAVTGRVRSMRVQPWGGTRTLECVLDDGTGGLLLVFLGRRHVAGISLGTTLTARGRACAHRQTLALLNPEIELLAPR